jgi:hypothetical protein
MKRYNARDVELLERVYNKLRPWATNHPNLNLYTNAGACPVCQSKKVWRKGMRYLSSTVREAMICRDCGKQWNGNIIKRDQSPKRSAA